MSTLDRSTRRPSADEIARINRAHLIDTRLRPADLLFTFGTREDVTLRADTAARLWHEGLFRWSIVSGGVTAGSEQSECTIIKAAMSRRAFRLTEFSRNIVPKTPART